MWCNGSIRHLGCWGGVRIAHILLNSVEKPWEINSRTRFPKNKYRGVEQLEARGVHNPEVAGSSPAPATVAVAQLVEHRVVVPNVVGSSPISHPCRHSAIFIHSFFYVQERRTQQFIQVLNNAIDF